MTKPLHSITLRLLFLVLSYFCVFHTYSQRYDFAASSGIFTPLVGGTDLDAIETDDALSSVVTLPGGMTFNYFGTDFTEFNISSNGFLTFESSGFSENSNEISTSFTNYIVAPLWDDLSGDGGQASYLITGAAPNRILTVEWLNWKWGYTAASAGISFQIKLYESTHSTSPNKIEFIYRQESGGLASASASIGLVGNNSFTSGHFYSLSNSGVSPVLSPAGVNNISTKPASGQIYAFTPNAASFLAPATQASNIITSNLTSSSVDVSWNSGNGGYRAVFVKQTSATENVALADGAFYRGDAIFAGGTQVGSTGWYCVYNGSGSGATITQLQSGLPYRVQVVEYNGLAGTQKYNITTAVNNPRNFTTVLVAPTAPISTITLTHKSATVVNFNVNLGNGSKRAIFMKAASSGTAAPVDNTTYVGNLNFGSGSQIGTSGWYCVFNGEAPSTLTISSLAGNTTYSIHIVDYNGAPGSERYFSSNATGNPVQVTTYVANALPTYTLTPTAGTFTPIVGGTAVNTIEDDDVLSPEIPIGFTFYHGAVPFTSLKASSNGFVTFNPYATNSSAAYSLQSSLARPLIAPLWDDVDGTGGQASYIVTGSAPNRVFTFEWLNWQWNYTATAGISFQIKLYETENKIEYVYRQEAGALNFPSASVGMAFPNTGANNFISLNNLSASPTTSLTSETTNISSKPANGQTYTFTPAKLSQTITFAPLSSKAFGNAAFNLTATASSSLQVSYSSSNPAVATVSGSMVTIVGVGTTTITASQLGDIVYEAALPVAQGLTVDKADQSLNVVAIPTEKNFGDPVFTISATATSGLPVTISSSNTSVATVSGNTVTIVGTGSVNITVSQPGNASYNPAADIILPLTVNKGNQEITFSALPEKTVGAPDFQLTATSSSGLPVSYTSSNTAVATISGSTVSIMGTGTTNITAQQVGNTNYSAAVDVVQVLVVKLPQSITFDALPVKTFGDGNFTLSAVANSQLPVSYSSSNTSVATVSDNVITIVGAGTTTITASQLGNGTYSAAAEVTQTLTINKANQAIVFNPLSAVRIGSAPFSLSATGGGSGKPITFFSSNTSVATVSGSMVTIVGAGTTSITASQAGDTNYNAAPDVVQVLTVNPKEDQTINFTTIADKTLGDPAFGLSAVASSGLTVNYATTSDKITISGSQITLVKAGRAAVTASQNGNEIFNAAPSVTQSFCIKPNKPTIAANGINTENITLTSSADEGNQWFKDGAALNGSTNKTLAVTTPGIYKVHVKVDDCFSEFSSDFAIVITGDIPSMPGISTFPNPVENVIEIQGIMGELKAYQLYDMTGRASSDILLEKRSTTYSAQAGHLAQGMYLLRLHVGNNTYQIKFIKK